MNKYKMFKWLVRPFYNQKTISLYKTIREEYEWAECRKSLKTIGEKSYLGADCHITGGKYIAIGNNVQCGRGLLLEAWDQYNQKPLGIQGIIVHDNVTNSPCNKLVRKRIIDENRFFFPDNCAAEDLGFVAMVLPEVKRCVLLQDAYYHYFLEREGILPVR